MTHTAAALLGEVEAAKRVIRGWITAEVSKHNEDALDRIEKEDTTLWPILDLLDRLARAGREEYGRGVRLAIEVVEEQTSAWEHLIYRDEAKRKLNDLLPRPETETPR